METSIPLDVPWQPTAEHLNMDMAKKAIPPLLYNFLAWTVGSSGEPSSDFVDVPDGDNRKLLSIRCFIPS